MKLTKHARNFSIIAEISIILGYKPDDYDHTSDLDGIVTWKENEIRYYPKPIFGGG